MTGEACPVKPNRNKIICYPVKIDLEMVVGRCPDKSRGPFELDREMALLTCLVK